MPAAAGAASQPLTLALAADSDPVWSPDGQRVAFRSLKTGRPALYVKRAHEKDAEDQSIAEGDATPTDWLGTNIIVDGIEAASARDINAIDDTRGTKTTLVKSGFNDTDGRWSPDGTWLAYVSDESGRPDIYASRRDGSRVRVSFAGGSKPRWSRDGQSIFLLRGSAIMRARLANSSPASFAPAVPVLDAPGIRDLMPHIDAMRSSPSCPLARHRLRRCPPSSTGSRAFRKTNRLPYRGDRRSPAALRERCRPGRRRASHVAARCRSRAHCPAGVARLLH